MTPPTSCPASAVILAARQAKTPLAIATASAPTILFANDAFAALLQCEPDVLVGRSLASIGTIADEAASGPVTRRTLVDSQGRSATVALSTAAVAGPDGSPSCLLCSLIDAHGDGADEAIAREAALLAEVAQAAGDLMRESAAAADLTPAATASDIAFDAIAHATEHGTASRA